MVLVSRSSDQVASTQVMERIFLQGTGQAEVSGGNEVGSLILIARFQANIVIVFQYVLGIYRMIYRNIFASVT